MDLTGDGDTHRSHGSSQSRMPSKLWLPTDHTDALMELDQILMELNNNAGTQFDPQVVRAFEQITTEGGETLVINSARAGINLRLHTELDDIYNSLLKERLEGKNEPAQELNHSAPTPVPALLDFSFTTLPRQY